MHVTRIRAFALLSVLLGCSTQDVVVSPPAARFETYPADLVEAFQAACSAPEQSFRTYRDGTVECREFMDPFATAAAILEFDGYPQDLPQLVLRFRIRDLAPGYLVQAETFLNVPQRDGPAKRIAPSDRRLTRQVNRLLAAVGGTPVRVRTGPAG